MANTALSRRERQGKLWVCVQPAQRLDHAVLRENFACRKALDAAVALTERSTPLTHPGLPPDCRLRFISDAAPCCGRSML